MHLIIIVRSAQVFKSVTFFSKMHLYAVAAVVDGRPSSSPLQSTLVDTRGCATPFWWSPMVFDVDETSEDEILALCIKNRRRSAIMGSDKSVGVVDLPVAALLEHYRRSSQGNNLPADIAVTISAKSGKPRGVLYLSYMFGGEAPPAPRPVPSAPPLEEYEDGGRHYCAPVAVVPSAPYLPGEVMLN